MEPLNILNEIRNKPEYIRKRILFLSTSVFAILIFSFWLSKMSGGFGGEVSDGIIEKEPSQIEVRSPFSLFSSKAPSFFDNLTGTVSSFFESKKTFSRDK